MQTVKDVTDTFEQIATDHKQINAFKTSTLDEVVVGKLGVTDYPILYAQCTSATIGKGTTELDFEIIIASYLVEEKLDYVNDVYAQLLLVFQDVIAAFSLSNSRPAGEVDETWGISLPVSCEPFTARFPDILTGWSATLSITIPNALDLCDAPFA